LYNKLIIIFLFFYNTSLLAQDIYKGTIENWDNKDAEIVLPIEEPIIIGKVSKNGSVIIDLKDELAKAIETSLAKENGDIKLITTTVNKSFYCDSENVRVKNGKILIQKLAGRGSFFVADIKAKELYGKFRIVNSTAFNESFFSLGKKDFVKGYYINFYHVNENASVKGECKTKSYTIDMKNTIELITKYDINLEKGWNMVKIQVVETYVDGEKVRPLITAISTINHIPKDAKFIFKNK